MKFLHLSTATFTLYIVLLLLDDKQNNNILSLETRKRSRFGVSATPKTYLINVFCDFCVAL